MNKIIVSAWPKEKNADKNPYNKILYNSMRDNADVKEFNKKKFDFINTDILHMHWPDHMLRLKNRFKIRLRLWRFSRIARRLHNRGGKIVWTVHNLRPHNASHPKLVDIGLKKIVELTDGFIFLSKESERIFFSLYPSAKTLPSIIIPHLHYKNYYKDRIYKSIARENKIQLLCFGLLREHKGYSRLFKAAKDIKYRDQVGWLVAGNPGKKGISDELKNLWDKNQIIYKACRYIDDNEIAELFGRCDAVVLPYEKILNSGTAILALSLGKRVIAPAMGSLVELQSSVGSDWVYLYESPINKEKLENAIEWIEGASPLKSQPDLELMSPKHVAKETLGFYNQLLSANSSR